MLDLWEGSVLRNRRCFLRCWKNRAMAMKRTARAPAATPTPMPAFAPEERPLLGADVGEEVAEVVVVGEEVDVVEVEDKVEEDEEEVELLLLPPIGPLPAR